MSRPTLDVDAVHAFVAIADCQSFTKAADMLGTTQGAVSVKLKRLEQRLGYRLVERTPRQVRLSAQGAAFIGAARGFLAAHDHALAALACERRRLRLGIAAHVAGPEVQTLLARLNAFDPALAIEVRMENSRDLLQAFDGGALDAVVVRAEDDHRDGQDLGAEHFGWFASPGFERPPGGPLRLASLSPGCGVRDIAARSLQAARIEWVEVFVGGSSGVMAAVSAGVAVAALSCRLAPAGVVEVGARFGLPALPPSRIMLHSARADERACAALRTLAAVYRDYGAAGGA